MSNLFILTNFTGWDEAYSLCHVVRNQAVMLMRAGHRVTVGVCRTFDPLSWPWSALTPEFARFDHMPVHDEWKNAATLNVSSSCLATEMAAKLLGEDLIITHDILFQPDAMRWNLATRRIIELYPDKRWLHWFHSPTPMWSLIDDRSTLEWCMAWPSRSWLVMPNHADLKRVGDRHNCPTNRRKVVHHAFDFEDHYFRGDSVGLRLNAAVKFEEYECVLLAVARLDRGKQVEHAIRITAALGRAFASSVLLVVDFHSGGGDKVTYRSELKELALQESCSVFFTSDLLGDARGVPHKTLMNLMRVAHVLVNASRSESYSLVVQEALLSRTIPVLNANYPAMKELWGQSAIYAEFGSDINTETMGDGQTLVSYDDVHRFAEDIASRIAEYVSLPGITGERKIRCSRSLDAIYAQQLGPLIVEARSS